MGRARFQSIFHDYRAAPSRRRIRAERIRATMLISRTTAISTNAAAHAWSCYAGSGDSENWKMTTGTLGKGCEGSDARVGAKIELTNSSGAVSPRARATASRAPVIIPLRAVGTTTETVVRHRLAPSARPASFVVSGTSARTSWQDRATSGSITTASATEPAKPL